MKAFTLLFASILILGCSTPSVPEHLPTPPRAEAVQVDPLHDATKETSDSIRKAQGEVTEAKAKTEEAQNRARNAEKLAEEAVANGLTKDSKEALKLSQEVTEIRKALDAAVAKIKDLGESLSKALSDAIKAQKTANDLEVALTVQDSELEAYRSLHQSANQRIEQAREYEGWAKDEIATTKEKLRISRGWTKRWAGGFIGLSALIAAYIYLRVSMAPWIR